MTGRRELDGRRATTRRPNAPEAGFDRGAPIGAPDRSNGWEAVADEVIAYSEESQIGVTTIAAWARTLPAGGAILDLGCGPGTPRVRGLVEAGFAMHGIDASPSMARAFAQRFPNATVACEAAEDSRFFGRTFDGVLAWGLLFLLSAETQRHLIRKMALALRPGGGLLFTAPEQPCTWADLSTGRESLSLGAAVYESLLAEAGLVAAGQFDDEGENHYYSATRPSR